MTAAAAAAAVAVAVALAVACTSASFFFHFNHTVDDAVAHFGQVIDISSNSTQISLYLLFFFLGETAMPLPFYFYGF